MRAVPHGAARLIVRLWFALDAVVALAPPIYWAANGRTVPILGMPAALFYFLAVDACIAASIVAAHLVDHGDEADPA